MDFYCLCLLGHTINLNFNIKWLIAITFNLVARPFPSKFSPSKFLRKGPENWFRLLVPGAGEIFSSGPPQRAECVELIYFREGISGNRQSFAFATLPSTTNQSKFISIHL